MNSNQILGASIVFIAAGILVFRVKKMRNRIFVYNSQSILEERLNAAGDLLDANPDIAPAFSARFEEASNCFTNLFSDQFDDETGSSWAFKRRGVEALGLILSNLIDDINNDIKILADAKEFAPPLLRSVRQSLSEIRGYALSGGFLDSESEASLARVQVCFDQASWALGQGQPDYALAWGLLIEADQRISWLMEP